VFGADVSRMMGRRDGEPRLILHLIILGLTTGKKTTMFDCCLGTVGSQKSTLRRPASSYCRVVCGTGLRLIASAASPIESPEYDSNTQDGVVNGEEKDELGIGTGTDRQPLDSYNFAQTLAVEKQMLFG
jgi:hypothetical protein